MKTVSISGSPRASVGKKDAKALRANGNVPCTLYGGTEQINFFAPYNDFRHVVYTPEVNKVTVKVDGKEYETLVQEIQFHPVNDKIMHIDFLQLFKIWFCFLNSVLLVMLTKLFNALESLLIRKSFKKLFDICQLYFIVEFILLLCLIFFIKKSDSSLPNASISTR